MESTFKKFSVTQALLLSCLMVAGQNSLSVDSASEAPIQSTLQATNQLQDSLQFSEVVHNESHIGAFTTISSENFNRGVVNHPLLLVRGKAAGLNIARPGGNPNQEPIARIRGIGTVMANPEPLFVIDGLIGASLQTIDPADIASITVLKDAASSSLYGARGANGVIIITSRSGETGKITTSYSTSVGFDKMARKIETMDIGEYRKVSSTPDYGGSPDWYDLIGRTGVSQAHHISVSGGSKNTVYRASINNRDIQGIQINSGFQQWNGSFSLTQKALNEKVTFNIQLANTTRESEFGVPEAWKYATIVNPTMPVYGEGMEQYGGYYHLDFFDHFNPLAMVSQNRRDGKSNVLTGRVGAEVDLGDIIDGLSAGISLSRQSTKNESGRYSRKEAAYGGGFPRNGLALITIDAASNQLFDAGLNYSKSAGDLRIKLTAAHAYQYFYNDGFSIEGGNFLTDAFSYHNLGAALDFANGVGGVDSYASSYTMVSFAGKASFDYKSTYFLTLGSNYNGSSRFGANQKWANFPSVGAAVAVTELFRLPLLNHLKIRYSWGQAGNIPSFSYGSLQRFEQIGRPNNISADYNNYNPQVYSVSNPNPGLKRELRTEKNFGVDYAIFKSRVKGSFDFYNSRSSDLLFPINVPSPPNVVSSTWMNILEIQNKGYELSLFYDHLNTAGLGWSAGLIASGFKSRMAKMTSGSLGIDELYRGYDGCGCSQGRIRTKEGEDIGQIWGPLFSRLNESGDPQFKDLNGDGYFCDCNDDYAVIGNALPKFSLGFDNTIRYKNLSVNSFFRGAFGHDLLNSYRTRYENLELSPYNVVTTKYFDKNLRRARFSDQMVEKASYLVLDNVTLAYEYPLTDSRYLSRLRFYVTVQNLFTLTGYSGFDSEVRYSDPVADGNSDQLAPGIENLVIYPSTKAYVMGFNVQF